MSNADLIEEMRWQLRKIEERKADNARLLAQPGSSVTSADGTVTVVAAGGVLQEVRLTPEAMRTDPARLGAVIAATVRDALAAGSPPAPAPRRVHTPRRRPAPEADDDEPFDTIFDE